MKNTVGKTIKCRAAVAWEANQPLKIEDIEVEPPKANEVRVKICYAALCHTDCYSLSGKDPEGLFPVILGHESAGVVESIGENVTSVVPGDHVIPVFLPQCKNCDYCKNMKSNHCSVIRDTQAKGLMPDGTSRFKCKGISLFHFMGCSSFSEYTVCAEISLVKVNSKASLEKICLLACGVSTGYGAVLKTCNVESGSRVAIWGLGTVGLAAIMGASDAKAKQIVAIDTNSKKCEIAKKFGATDFLNPNNFLKEKSFQQYLIENFDGGFDYTIECVGNIVTMRQAFEAAHKGWGISCIVGVAGSGEEFSTRPFQFITGRTLKGSSLGGWKTRDEIPKLVDKYLKGNMNLDNFITHKFKLEDINKSIDCLLNGESLRSVITIE